MKLLSVRLTDEEHGWLKARADGFNMTVSALVKDWIGSFGGSEVVPPPAVGSLPPESGSSAASLPPQAPFEEFDQAIVMVHPDAVGEWAVLDPLAGEKARALLDVSDVHNPNKVYMALPEFLAAPVDECALCTHDRQASSHLGGQACKFKIGRRNCGCTFEGF